MRWTEILNESPKTYMPMYQALLSLDIGEQTQQYASMIKEDIVNAERIFNKKRDRMVWWCRWHRVSYVRAMMQELDRAIVLGDDAEREEAHATMQTLENLKKRYMMECGVSSDAEFLEHEFQTTNLMQMSHLLNTPAPAIQSYVFDRQLPKDLMDDLKELEKEWQETRKQELDFQDEEVFLQVDKEWAWYDLETYYCDREAKAMGHCGNQGGDSSSTILSLRRMVADGRVRPSLTFILNNDGFLGEMKGRANNKPDPKYHPAIKMLLMDPRIVGIDGGGYAPEANFDLEDLVDDEEWVEELKEKKPGMLGVSHLYENWVEGGKKEGVEKDKVEQKIRSSLKARDYGYKKLLMDQGVIRVDIWDSRKAYADDYRSYCKYLEDFFNSLPVEIERRTQMISAKAEGIAAAAYSDLYTSMFDELLPYDVEYIIANDGEGSFDMSPEWEDGKLVLDVPIEGYLYVFHDSENANHYSWGKNRVEHLDEISQHNDHNLKETGLIDGQSDELVRDIYEFLEEIEASYAKARRTYGQEPRKEPPMPKSIVKAVIERYKDAAAGARTIKDPNQLEFEFMKDEK